ncbi:pregnancy zone protein-like [Amphiura filiformis]|uniref:pregnancy zone protein-like n=1 Tax=Amphiura filiformis TaxID=82378 RepID=UPI003B222385
MSPVTSVIVYYVRKDNEVVSEMIDFDVQEVFENEVKMTFNKPEEKPRSLTKLRIQASPGSLCAYGVVDRAIHLMGEQNRITRKKAFNALARLQLSAADGFADTLIHNKCGDIFKFPVFGKKVGLDPSRSIADSMIQIPGFEPELMDSSIAFRNMGIVYLTNLDVETKPCPKYRMENQFKDKPAFGRQEDNDATSAADTVSDVPYKTLKLKSFFPETWLWEIKRTSEEHGEADVNVLVPDRITTWIGRGFCTNTRHGAGVSDLFPLKVFQPFYLELELPPSVIRGEKVPVKVHVYDYLQECMVIKVSLKKSDDYTSSELKPEKTVCVCNGMPATVVFYIVPHIVEKVQVEVYGISMEDNIDDSVCGEDPVDMVQIGLHDSVKKPLSVQYRGIYVEDVFSSHFCPSDYSDGIYAERVLLRELPANVVPGSVSAVVSITGDMIAPSLIHLDSLLRLPLVSGEQNLLDFAPNVFMLRYLKATHQLTPKLQEQAIANMITGYQRQETFRRKDGSYNVFRDDLEGSSWLTAYVVRVYAYASQYMSVDVGNLVASVKWLKSLQDAKTGCFRPTGRIIHRALKGSVRDEVALTAYIVSAMLEAGIPKRDPSIRKSWECLDLALNGMGDVYTAALMAYTFALADQPCIEKAINILNQLAVEEHGTIYWETQREDVPYEEPYLHRKAAAQNIEMTSYVLLSYAIYREDTSVIRSGSKIAHWIIMQLNANGGFASTQDTMVALQALSEYARVSRISRGHTDINVKVHFGCEKEPHNLDVTEDNRFKLQEIPVPLIPEDIIIDAKGDACAMSQVIVKYNIIPEVPQNPKFILTYEFHHVGDDCGVQKMKICATYAGEDPASNLAVISIKLISGYSPDEASVNDLRKRGLKRGLKRVEIDGSNVDIFVDKFTLKEKCFHLRVRKEFDVRDTKKGVITVYDYYEPSRTVSTFFKFGCKDEDENDENDPRPGLCPNVDGMVGICVELCRDDDSCEGQTHKCCSNGCGHMCMLPIGLEKPAAEQRFGSCPFVNPSPKNSIKLCEDQCNSDEDCEGVKKCCTGPKKCGQCYLPSELNPCPMCLSHLPDVPAESFCKYDFVITGRLLKDDGIKISRNMQNNKKIHLPDVKRVMKPTCECPVCHTKSLVLLMFNNKDLDLDENRLILGGNTIILKYTPAIQTALEKLPKLCSAKK